MLDKSRFYRVFVEILIFQVVLAVVLCMKKPSYFVDEIWTYNLANSYMFPAFGNVEGYFYKWLQPDFWRTLIVVVPGKEFSYNSVWYNQSQDVLPPFFYTIVHTTASFFPGQFSNWFVLGPNLLFFVGTQILLLKISNKVYGCSWFALIPCLVYGLTLGGINTVLYFRMYMMLTFFGMLAFYLHILLYENINVLPDDTKIRRLLFAICATNVFGFLTHYYYIVYLFFVSVFILWYIKTYRMHKIALNYIFMSIAALTVSIIIFPVCVKQILGIGDVGMRGAQSFSNAFNSDFFKRLTEMNSLLIRDLGGDLTLVLLLIISLLILNSLRKLFIDIIINKDEAGYRFDIDFHKASPSYSVDFQHVDILIFWSLFITVAYYLFIVKISAIIDDRYIFIILPHVVFWGFYLINRIVTGITNKQYLAAVLCVITLWLSAVSSFRIDRIKFADMEIRPTIESVEKEYSDIPMLVVNCIPHWHPILEQVFLLEKTSKAFLTTEDEIDKVKPALEEINFTGEKLLVFVTWECKKSQKEIQEELKIETGFKHFKVLYNGGQYKRGHMYLMTR